MSNPKGNAKHPLELAWHIESVQSGDWRAQGKCETHKQEFPANAVAGNSCLSGGPVGLLASTPADQLHTLLQIR